ncbi:Organic hydroperoxide resistance transcriptional regulator [Microbacterium ginsengisoli]|uniref:Organic hydroperoxide resistance transcriptional regulator n=1 Tax=Microbacterium ginsengisoli TaxID=400772 RepID=A0A0F0M004_9MICO|nr:MarR family transcriptional regulator [Microbacterium ginsengisoli]KJL44897.1 Organic hydroperoxide resistance transcriptional regulator [Microbacterium ginsengisoli]
MQPSVDMLCFALYSAARATTQAYRSLLEPLGLTYPQYLVLVLLSDDRARTVSEIGDELSLDSGTLSPLLRRMEQAGFVTRSRRARDERVVEIGLADRGREVRAQLAPVAECVFDAMGLGAENGIALRSQLHALTAALQAAPDLHPALAG